MRVMITTTSVIRRRRNRDTTVSTNSAPRRLPFDDIHPNFVNNFQAVRATFSVSTSLRPERSPIAPSITADCTHACICVYLSTYPLAWRCWLQPWRAIWGTTCRRPVYSYEGNDRLYSWKTRLERFPIRLLVCVPWLVPTTRFYVNDSAVILYQRIQHCVQIGLQSAVVG